MNHRVEWPFFVKFCFAPVYAWSSEAWLSKLGYTLKLVVNVFGEL